MHAYENRMENKGITNTTSRVAFDRDVGVRYDKGNAGDFRVLNMGSRTLLKHFRNSGLGVLHWHWTSTCLAKLNPYKYKSVVF